MVVRIRSVQIASLSESELAEGSHLVRRSLRTARKCIGVFALQIALQKLSHCTTVCVTVPVEEFNGSLPHTLYTASEKPF